MAVEHSTAKLICTQQDTKSYPAVQTLNLNLNHTNAYIQFANYQYSDHNSNPKCSEYKNYHCQAHMLADLLTIPLNVIKT